MSGVLKKPLITEKYNDISERLNQFAFVVERKATKAQIKAEIERLYDVKVTSVRTMVYGGKPKFRYTKKAFFTGRTSAFKKAVVSVADGQQIDFYSNI